MTQPHEIHESFELIGGTPLDDALLAEVDEQVGAWLEQAKHEPEDPAASMLADVLKDPGGLSFTVDFIDRVIRPEDPAVAAEAMQELVDRTPKFLPFYLRSAMRAGAGASNRSPRVVIPIVRRALRQMVRHLVVDATPEKLGPAIRRIRDKGMKLNINLLGEAVLGAGEAARRLEGIQELLARDDVEYVSVKVSSAVTPHTPWAFDRNVEEVVEALVPLYRQAVESPAPKFINLDMEEYHDLDVTIAVFTRLLDRSEFQGLRAGIVLQAYLPDAMAAMQRLQAWAAQRVSNGGAPIKVRLVKGANLPMERTDASLHGWPVATMPSKQASDTNYKRVLHYALDPARIANVELGIAGHNLYDVAYAWILAGRVGVRDKIEIEMLLGMASGQAEAVRRTVGEVLLYVPVVQPKDFDVAISYLVRRLEEGASHQNFMSAVFDMGDDATLRERERERFIAAARDVDATVPAPHRVQNRLTEDGEESVHREGFANVPDTDMAVAGNREWARRIIERTPGSTVGEDIVAAHTVRDADTLEEQVAGAIAAAPAWGSKSGAERAAVLRSAAGVLAARRGEFLEVMASECGKTLDQSDPEISEAIDFVNYYADLAEALDEVDGAIHRPVTLTVVTPPWNFPVAIPTGSTVAPLAAGSAVVVKPAPQAQRCGSVMVQALWDAGVPKDVLRLVHVEEGDLGRALVADPRVDRLILTGGFETAQLFKGFRPDLKLFAETSGKNALIITPHADRDLAVKDLVNSAFGHAGQKCSAASLGILVGSVATSQRFLDQLVDAVTSLVVAYPDDSTAQMGPVIEPPGEKLTRGLTTLGRGEKWLVEPKQLDESGRLWSPGVRIGVRPGSEFHLTEYFGPVLGLMRADTLDEAIELANRPDYGLTGGLHSLERREIEKWLEHVQVGNAYINRGITGAIVRRQPFGGWKRSVVGPTTKAGGPNYLVGLSDWEPARARHTATVDGDVRRYLDEALRLEEGLLGAEDRGFLRRALGSDATAWLTEFGVARDVSGLLAELNYLRYRPVPVVVRVEELQAAELIRVVGAGIRAGAAVLVSTAAPLPAAVAELLERFRIEVRIEDGDAFGAFLRAEKPERVRLLGGDAAAFAAQSEGDAAIALYDGPVLEAGRIEMLPFLHEQAIAVTAHRFGSPTSLVDGLFA